MAICMSKILGVTTFAVLENNTWQPFLRVHVCLAHSSSHAVISSYSVGISRFMEGHLQAELEGTAAVTACKPYSDCDKCLSDKVQDAYFVSQRIQCLARSFHLLSLVLTLLNKVSESQMRCVIVVCLKSFRNYFLVIIVDICLWFTSSS